MTDITPVGSPMFPVDRTARLMLVCARQDPGLLSRSSNQQPDEQSDSLFDLPALFHWRRDLSGGDEGFSGEHYLEELVSLASEAADRAGDASRRAADATVALRHSRVAFAVLGVIGMAIGLAAAAGSVWNGAERQSRVAGDLTAVQLLQRRADQQLEAVAAAQNQPVGPVQTAANAPPIAATAPQTVALAPQTVAVVPQPADVTPQPADVTPQSADVTPQSADVTPQSADVTPQSADVTPRSADVTPQSADVTPQTAAIGPLPRLHAITVATRQEWSASPVGVPRSQAHAPRASAWEHKRRRPVRRVYRYYYPPGPPVVLVRVVQNIQRDVGSLFR
jgi:hypothetical protein